MQPPSFDLTGAAADRTVLTDATAGLPTVGLDGVLAERGRRARRARVPATGAVEGYRWGLADSYTQTWWPQGVAVGEHDGTPLVMTSWFAKPKRGREMGSRISIIDLRNPRRARYHHVLLVSPRRTDTGSALDPVRIHAGGIVWVGDRLFVAATYGGIREFRLSDIVRAPSHGMLRLPAGPFGYRFVLPESGSYLPPDADGPKRMRYSFLSSESGSGIRHSADDEELRLVAGEYGTNDRRRLARLRLLKDGTVTDEAHVPKISHMQGAVLHDGIWFVSASRGDKTAGDLWTGTPGAMTRHAGVLPPGPEDLAAWPDRDQLWSVSEFPGKRWVFGVGLSRWAPQTPVAGSA
jgi:hypothetical protein